MAIRISKLKEITPGKFITLSFFIILVFLLQTTKSISKDDPKIYSLENKKITISDNWSGQSIVLIKENETYYIIRVF